MKIPEDAKTFLTFAFIALIGLSFASTVMSFGLNSGIGLFLENEGEPAALAGILLTIFTVSSTIARFVTGDMTDHLDHESFLLWGTAILTLGIAIPILSSDFIVLSISRVIQGIGFCIVTTVSTVLVGETVPKGKLSEALGYRGLGSALGTAIGPTVAVVAVGLGGCAGLHLAITGISLIGALLAVGLKIQKSKRTQTEKIDEASLTQDQSKLIAEDATTKEPVAQADSMPLWYRLFEPKVLPACMTECMRRLMNGACTSFVVIYGLLVGIEEASSFFVAASVAVILCRLFCGKWMDTANGYLVMGVSCFSCVIGFVLVLVFPCLFTYIIAGLSYGIMEGIGCPYTLAQTMRLSPKEHWGVASSNYFLFGDFGCAAGAWACGVIIDVLGYGIVPWFVIVCSLLTFGCAVILRVAGPYRK